ncbi:MAG TPA: CapA family protein [Myxococcota bacterium]|nr:CapA family protein [Myxococcota bacterium]
MSLLVLACSSSSVKLEVLGEDGAPLSGAIAIRPDASIESDSTGRIALWLDRPELWLVEAPGHIAEPVIVGPDDHFTRIEVRLLREEGRHVLHFGGDVMLGRRYEQPSSGVALIDPADRDACSRRMVSDLAPLFAAADISMVNLESVLGDLGDADAYPAKRWLIQTHPDSLAAFEELGVDLVGLANNHQRDWLDDGVGSTIDALDARGLPWLGAGADIEESLQTRVLVLDDLRVGVVAFTSVDGAYVNETLPTADDDLPSSIGENEAWKWEERSWGTADIPEEQRLPGDAWRLFISLEDELDDPAEAWASLRAVYPELQDWVAHRGHGGAAAWDQDTAELLIAELDSQVDLVVAQLHMGYQFSNAPSAGVREAAKAAIDAGADIVVGHHPHVLQGIEVSDGKLMAWSLGNLAFDQDFLATWRSAVLRTVYSDDGELVQARLVPLVMDDYRPVPVHGVAARDILREAYERGVSQTTARRGEDDRVRAMVEAVESEPVGFVLEHGTVRIVVKPRTTDASLSVPRKDTAELPQDGLVAVTGEGVLVGRDLWSFGSFEDEDADTRDDILGWSLSPSAEIVHSGDQQRHVLELRREPLNSASVVASFTARAVMFDHRVWTGSDGVGLDGEASWSVRFLARGKGDRNEGLVNVTLVHYDDTDPTIDPWTVTLAELELPFSIGGVGWQEVLVEIPPEALVAVDGLSPNAARVQLELPPPPFRSSLLQIDEVEFIEWRPARGDLGAYRRVRSEDGKRHTADLELLPW